MILMIKPSIQSKFNIWANSSYDFINLNAIDRHYSSFGVAVSWLELEFLLILLGVIHVGG